MAEEAVVVYDSPEAATFKTNIAGWVSRSGRFFGDNEHMARWDGSTHGNCSGCGSVCSKHYTMCDECRSKRDAANYEAMPTSKWDGTTPIYSHVADKYFSNDGDLSDFCEENECDPSDLRLVICQPQFGRPIDSDYFCDELPEDGEVPDVIASAMEALNQAIKDAGPLSWIPGEVAAIVLTRADLEQQSTEGASCQTI